MTAELWMCHGCCCGVAEKDLKYDPPRESLDRIRKSMEDALKRQGAKPAIRLVKTGCLGPCANGNVMLVAKKGEPAVVFEGINSVARGVALVGYAAGYARQGANVALPPELSDQVLGTVDPAEMQPAPDPRPYADKHP